MGGCALIINTSARQQENYRVTATNRRAAQGVLNQLIAFEAAARLGSFRAAAEELFITQGAVAQQIRALEEKLGVKLFKRLARGLEATEEAVEYVGKVRLALGIIDDATERLLHPEPGRAAHQVLLTTTPAFASRWLIPRLGRLAEAHPEIALMIDASDARRPLKGKGAVDLAVRWGTPPFEEKHTRFLLPGRAMAVCSPALLPNGPLSTPDALARLPLISDSHGNWKRWFEAYAEPGLSFQGPSFSLTSLALEAAERGMGVALAPFALVEGALRSGLLVRALDEALQLDTQAGFYMLSGQPALASGAVGKVVAWLLLESETLYPG